VHGFVITSVFFFYLLTETRCLIFGIVKLGEAVSQFTTTNKKFETVGDEWVVVVTTRQWRYFPRVFGDEGWLIQFAFCGFFEDFAELDNP